MSDNSLIPKQLDGRVSLSLSEVAVLTGIKSKTLINYANGKNGPKMGAYQFNGKFSAWRFNREKLEAWMVSRMTEHANKKGARAR